jgi:hypothetical protein
MAKTGRPSFRFFSLMKFSQSGQTVDLVTDREAV